MTALLASIAAAGPRPSQQRKWATSHTPVLARGTGGVHVSGDSFPVPLFLFPPRMTHFSEYPTGDSSISKCKPVNQCDADILGELWAI